MAAHLTALPRGAVAQLAKLTNTSDGQPQNGPDLSHSPTMTYGGTQANVILGTARYMSPEQARGSRPRPALALIAAGTAAALLAVALVVALLNAPRAAPLAPQVVRLELNMPTGAENRLNQHPISRSLLTAP